MKTQNQIEQPIFIPYQKCPICNGEGKISGYNGLSGHGSTVTTPIHVQCPTCLGNRVVPMFCIPTNQPECKVWSWDDYEQNDPSGELLKMMKMHNPEEYKRIFKEKFGE